MKKTTWDDFDGLTSTASEIDTVINELKGLEADDLTAISKLSEKVMTPEQIADAIEQAHLSKDAIEKIEGLVASASEIDSTINNNYIDITSNTNTEKSVVWTIGGVTSDGVLVDASDRIRSDFIDISNFFGKLKLENNRTIYRINQYDATYKHIAQIQVNSIEYESLLPNVKYVVLVVLGTTNLSLKLFDAVETFVPTALFVKSPKNYGFHPSSSAAANTFALNECLKQKGEISVDIIGDYLINDSIIIHSDTHLKFGKGVNIKRDSSRGYALINEGAFTRTYNQNIKISGMNLICNGNQSNQGNLISGLRGQVAFFYIKNLEIENFTCKDLLSYSFGIHVCTFDNIIIDKTIIFGDKDAIHLGRGDKFVIKNGIFNTFDDPIALNGHDYATSNPEMGWITNGIIENCYDLNAPTTTGYFCRILAGAWVDWFSGMEIQSSDTIVVNGRMYRSKNSVDGTKYTSLTAPSHLTGSVTIDGIIWVMFQEDVEYSAGVKNVIFRDIYLQKNRTYAVSIHFDKDNYSRSYYPNAEIPIQSNITFDNVVCDGAITSLVRAVTPIDSIKILNTDMKKSKIQLDVHTVEGLVYPDTKILLSNCTFSASGSNPLVTIASGRTASFKALGSVVLDDTYVPTFSTACSIISSDL